MIQCLENRRIIYENYEKEIIPFAALPDYGIQIMKKAKLKKVVMCQFDENISDCDISIKDEGLLALTHAIVDDEDEHPDWLGLPDIRLNCGEPMVYPMYTYSFSGNLNLSAQVLLGRV